FESGRLLRPVVEAGHQGGALQCVLAAHGLGDAAAGVVADLPAARVVEGEAVGEAEDDQAGRGLDGVGHLVVLAAAAEHRVLGDLVDHGNPSVGCWWWIPGRSLRSGVLAWAPPRPAGVFRRGRWVSCRWERLSVVVGPDAAGVGDG